jgi:hypothetical protein
MAHVATMGETQKECHQLVSERVCVVCRAGIVLSYVTRSPHAWCKKQQVSLLILIVAGPSTTVLAMEASVEPHMSVTSSLRVNT